MVVVPRPAGHRYDTIVWMVDAGSGERIGRPWVFLDRSPFPRDLQLLMTTRNLRLLPSRYEESHVLSSIIEFVSGR